MTTGIRSTIAWVFQDTPGKLSPDVDFWLIKAANGGGHTNPEGFDYRANYAEWAKVAGEDRCAAWTWLYSTTDGAQAAIELHDSAPNARCYVIDVEGDDPSGLPVPEHVVRDFVATIKHLAPHAPVGFTSYPYKASATAHGVPWDQLVLSCDFGMPQVYFQTQGAHWETIRADHQGMPLIPAFSPGDWSGCWDLAGHAVSLYGGASFWRYPSTDGWGEQIRALKTPAGGGSTPPPPSPPSTPPTTSSNWEPTVHNIDLRNAEHALVTGPGVRPLQVLLNDAGYHVQVDGKAGPLTKAAVEAFQTHHGLAGDAIAGAGTFGALLNR